MTIFRSKELLTVASVAVLILWVWTVASSIRSEEVRISGWTISKCDYPVVFWIILSVQLIMAVLLLLITAQLVFDFDVRFWL